MAAEVPPAIVQSVEKNVVEAASKITVSPLEHGKEQELRAELADTNKKLAKVGFRLGQARVELLELEDEEDVRQKELAEVSESVRKSILENHEPDLLAYHKELAAADERLVLHKQDKVRSLSGVVNRVKHAFNWSNYDGLIQDQQIIQKKALTRIAKESSVMSHEAQVLTWDKTNPYKEGYAGRVSRFENPELKQLREKVRQLEIRYSGLEQSASVVTGQLR